MLNRELSTDEVTTLNYAFLKKRNSNYRDLYAVYETSYVGIDTESFFLED